MYDVIVVGARVAGSTTAMLLARRGLRVLVVDRASFPSDTLSTHVIQVPGVARLARMGLADRIRATGTPAVSSVRFETGRVRFEGRYPAFDGVAEVLAPRRTVLDRILVDAAREAGAEVRENVTVEHLDVEGGRVVGIRGRGGSGQGVTERAGLVVGADGKHSIVAKGVRAEATRTDGARSIAYYTYWENVPLRGGALHTDDARSLGVWPTNDGLVVTYLGLPASAFPAFRSDVEASFLRNVDATGELGEIVRAGRRVERFYGTADLPNRVSHPVGPGWALVGDAGLVMDPITGQGIGHAVRDAELLSEAVVEKLGGGRKGDRALADYERTRDRSTIPMYSLTLDLASIRPQTAAERALFESLATRQDQVDRFLGVLTGSVEIGSFFNPLNLVRLVGLRGFARLAAARRNPPPEAPREAPVHA
jgi:flavin-dependent dehydrogenase